MLIKAKQSKSMYILAESNWENNWFYVVKHK